MDYSKGGKVRCSAVTYWHREKVQGDIEAKDGNFGPVVFIRDTIQIFQQSTRRSRDHAYQYMLKL